MSKKLYNGFQFIISDQCKCPEFRRQFRVKWDGLCLGMTESTHEDAEDYKMLNFKFTSIGIGTELYKIKATKGGIIVRENNNMIAYVVHPEGIEYKGCYL